ncbi:5015_t:CDS:2 [Ambispora gerdemannii]|uniref:5015_t:CDS:1 n=1 Tax=Ambispora gerdemannii TaxID=144530 RepID=A0A9N9FVW7_9GLOM|nr:5015_t:CDS:2 [Ambispora gerdemannii]
MTTFHTNKLLLFETLLGFLDQNEIIFERDLLTAFEIYNKCAHNEDSQAQFLSGYAYER